MNEDKFIELIGKKLSNSLTQEEEKLFTSSLNDNTYNLLYTKYKSLWKESREEINAFNTQSTFRKVISQINHQQNEYIIPELQETNYNWNNRLRRFAAIIGFFVAVSFGVYWFIHIPAETIELQTKEIIKSNPRGQKSTVFLPDGSKVILNSESSITYSSIFAKDTREVRISGEAYFEVEHDSERPFIVKTDYVDVKVLGTSFNVKAYKGLKSIKVSLAEGKVEIHKNGEKSNSADKATLIPNQTISYSINESSFGKITHFNPEAEYGWKDGLIYFEKASFNEVVSRLKSWYGVSFVIKGEPVKEWNYSGKFDNYALSNVLNAVSFTGKFKYELKGKKVTIKF